MSLNTDVIKLIANLIPTQFLCVNKFYNKYVMESWQNNAIQLPCIDVSQAANIISNNPTKFGNKLLGQVIDLDRNNVLVLLHHVVESAIAIWGSIYDQKPNMAELTIYGDFIATLVGKVLITHPTFVFNANTDSIKLYLELYDMDEFIIEYNYFKANKWRMKLQIRDFMATLTTQQILKYTSDPRYEHIVNQSQLYYVMNLTEVNADVLCVLVEYLGVIHPLQLTYLLNELGCDVVGELLKKGVMIADTHPIATYIASFAFDPTETYTHPVMVELRTRVRCLKLTHNELFVINLCERMIKSLGTDDEEDIKTEFMMEICIMVQNGIYNIVPVYVYKALLHWIVNTKDIVCANELAIDDEFIISMSTIDITARNFEIINLTIGVICLYNQDYAHLEHLYLKFVKHILQRHSTDVFWKTMHNLNKKLPQDSKIRYLHGLVMKTEGLKNKYQNFTSAVDNGIYGVEISNQIRKFLNNVFDK